MYILMACAGCDNVKLLRKSWFSEITDGQGAPEIREISYPPETDRRTPEWLSSIVEPFDFDENSEHHSIRNLLLENLCSLPE